MNNTKWIAHSFEISNACDYCWRCTTDPAMNTVRIEYVEYSKEKGWVPHEGPVDLPLELLPDLAGELLRLAAIAPDAS